MLLLTSFAQSLSADGFGYFLLLLIEAFAVIWWGAGWHLKTPFFIGIAASVLNVLAQIVVLVNVHDVNRFVVIFTAGLMLTLALYPYVYLLARASFLEQSACALDVARSLGRSPWRMFVEVAVPLARPAAGWDWSSATTHRSTTMCDWRRAPPRWWS